MPLGGGADAWMAQSPWAAARRRAATDDTGRQRPAGRDSLGRLLVGALASGMGVFLPPLRTVQSAGGSGGLGLACAGAARYAGTGPWDRGLYMVTER